MLENTIFPQNDAGMVRQVAFYRFEMTRWAIYLAFILTGCLTMCGGDREVFECPEQFGYYPDVKDCSKYFVCVHGEPLHESCTGGLYFSAELQTCDWPRNAKCAASEISPGIRSRSADNNQISSQSNTCRSCTRPRHASTTALTTATPVTRTTKSQFDHREHPSSDNSPRNKTPFQGGADPYPLWNIEFGDSVPVAFDPDGGVHYEESPITFSDDVPRLPSVSNHNGFGGTKLRNDRSQKNGKEEEDDKRPHDVSANSGDTSATSARSYDRKQANSGVNKTARSFDYTDDFPEVLNWSPSEKNRPLLYNGGTAQFQFDYSSDSDSSKDSSFYSSFHTSPLPQYSESGDSVEDNVNTVFQDRSTVESTTHLPHVTSFNITVNHDSVSGKCNPRYCVLPDCRCGGTDIPGGLPVRQVPQMVLLTFDDAINDLNFGLYNEIFLTGRKNPNGCPILGTFYVSHEWTDYGQVQTLYSKGHEMASHSITRSYGEQFSKSQWYKEIQGQREILHKYGNVKLEDIRGMRAPFLQIGGNNMFDMLYESNFSYDASMPIFENNPPFWPYTLDYPINHECMITPCPTKSYPGLWELGLVMWLDLRGGRCSMADACSNTPDEASVIELLMKNFNRHYNNNRAPFGLYYHSSWFNTAHHRKGFMKFIDTILDKGDVWFVTTWQLIQWMETPKTLDDLPSFEPWQCDRRDDLPPPCLQPNVCSVWYQGGVRYMKTCKPCPKEYPWLAPEVDP